MPRDCKTCDKRETFVRDSAHKAAMLAGRTVVGLGVGACIGVGALAAAAIAEVAIPAILTFQVLGLTCGAAGFLRGAKDLKSKRKKARDEQDFDIDHAIL